MGSPLRGGVRRERNALSGAHGGRRTTAPQHADEAPGPNRREVDNTCADRIETNRLNFVASSSRYDFRTNRSFRDRTVLETRNDACRHTVATTRSTSAQLSANQRGPLMSTPTQPPPRPAPTQRGTDNTASPTRSLAELAEDHALVSVPAADRKSGWRLSVSTVGVVTALVIFAITGYSVILAGFRNALVGGLIVGMIGFVLGDRLGRMAYRTGVSSTVTSRFFGLGVKGSALAAGIFAFMVLGFLALESALLYEGTLVMFDWDDTIATKIGIYGVLTLTWIALAIFGLELALRASGFLIAVTLVVAVFVVVQNFADTDGSFSAVFSTPGVVPGGNWAQIEAVIGLAGATAAAIALVTADIARYARSSKDVTVLAASGPVVQGVVMSVLGALVIVPAIPRMIDYLMQRQAGLSPQEAGAMAGGFAMGNTGAFFVVVAGWLGFVTIYATQSKAQAINAYSGSLALVNLVNAVTNRRAPRALMVVVGNAIALGMIAGGILGHFTSWLSYLGAITFSLCGVMIADYYIVRGGSFENPSHRVENINWAGVLTLTGAAALGIWLMSSDIWPLGFIASFAATLVVYPLLRRALPEGSATGFSTDATALDEAS